MKLENSTIGSNSSESVSSEFVESSFPQLENTSSPKENINTLSLYSNKHWLNTAESNSSSFTSNTDKSKNKLKQQINNMATSTTKDSEIATSFIRARPSACVFVASLCSSMSDDELCFSVTNHFSQWGKLATVKVLRDTSNRPYAFVQYTTDEDSKLAIENGHNSILDGRNIRCEAAKVNRTLFISSRSFLTHELVESIFSQFGEVEDLVPSTSKGDIYTTANDAKGYKNWFCKFVYRDDAIRAYANLTEEGIYKIDWTQNIDKSRVPKNVDEEESEEGSENETKVKFDKYSIFVGQLSSEVTDEKLCERFERHGEIVDLKLVKRTNNTFAFIKFKEESSAAGAVERENHSMFCGKTMHVQYRETHTPAPVRSKNFSTNGIALAPPPINLNKKSFDKKEFAGKSSSPENKPKFNGYPSNTYNRGFNKFKPFKNFKPVNFERKSVKAKPDTTWQASQLSLKSEVVSQTGKRVTRGGGGAMVDGNSPNYSGSQTGSRGSGYSSKNNNNNHTYPPHSTPGYPLFYYVPAENVSFGSSGSSNNGVSPAPAPPAPPPHPPAFYNLYPHYYPAAAHPHGNPTSTGISNSFDNSMSTNLIGSGTGGGSSDYQPVGSHPSYGIANYVYYPTETELASHEKKS
ncbi:RIM4 Meiotic activator RIM4 [Candida maltosa Xu316]|uniref:RNA-binding protein, putative n=1 Tax=Candida maltosa (strain Xu316) TaxID=1245528 RepID=M3IHL1_CANMX|nr:RNA-binding protein, putative [Candida maltosa Xu316]